MPWRIESDNPECDGYAVVKEGTDEVVGCHDTREQALAHQRALYASEPDAEDAAPAPAGKAGLHLVGAVKAIAEGAQFEGWASTSDLDRQGDVVEPSAFARSLPAFLRNGPIFWAHAEAYDPLAKPIGKAVDGRIERDGLWIRAKWASTPEAEEVRSLVLDGIVNSLSIGFNPVTMHRDKQTGVNVITDLDLLEVSVVTIPANPAAVITAAKHLAELPPRVRRNRVITRLR